MPFMREILHKERAKGRWKCRYEGQEMTQEVVYTIIDFTTSKRYENRVLRKTSIQSLQT